MAHRESFPLVLLAWAWAVRKSIHLEVEPKPRVRSERLLSGPDSVASPVPLNHAPGSWPNASCAWHHLSTSVCGQTLHGISGKTRQGVRSCIRRENLSGWHSSIPRKSTKNANFTPNTQTRADIPQQYGNASLDEPCILKRLRRARLLDAPPVATVMGLSKLNGRSPTSVFPCFSVTLSNRTNSRLTIELV